MHFSPSLLTPVFYLDPGSGSILFQLVVAAFLGAGILIRTQWTRIKRWLGAKPPSTEKNEDDNEEDSGS